MQKATEKPLKGSNMVAALRAHFQNEGEDEEEDESEEIEDE